MLILTRKPGESVYIGDNVKITIVEIKGHQIRVGIEAPKDLRIYREEIWEQIREENRQAADSGGSSDSGLDSLSAAWGKKQGSGRVSKLSSMKVGAAAGGAPQSEERDGEVNSAKKNQAEPQVIKRRKKRSKS